MKQLTVEEIIEKFVKPSSYRKIIQITPDFLFERLHENLNKIYDITQSYEIKYLIGECHDYLLSLKDQIK